MHQSIATFGRSLAISKDGFEPQNCRVLFAKAALPEALNHGSHLTSPGAVQSFDQIEVTVAR